MVVGLRGSERCQLVLCLGVVLQKEKEMRRTRILRR